MELPKVKKKRSDVSKRIEVLKKNNFYVDYQEASGWGSCYNCFFEVWKRI